MKKKKEESLYGTEPKQLLRQSLVKTLKIEDVRVVVTGFDATPGNSALTFDLRYESWKGVHRTVVL